MTSSLSFTVNSCVAVGVWTSGAGGDFVVWQPASNANMPIAAACSARVDAEDNDTLEELWIMGAPESLLLHQSNKRCPTDSCAAAQIYRCVSVAKIGELQRLFEFCFAQHRHDFLQVIALLAGHAHLFILNLCRHF